MSDNNMIQRIQNPPKPVSISSLTGACILAGAKIALGAMHLDDCPIQPYIPIYLIVFGVFSIVVSIISALPWTRQPRDERTALGGILLVIRNVLNTFLFAWFIAGSYWIYSLHATGHYPGFFCNRVLYLFAFWTTTVIYIIIALGVVFCCIPLLCAFFCVCLCSPVLDDVEDV
ncbi:transmembrane protein 272-like [Neosynchiropus ocellatus]